MNTQRHHVPRAMVAALLALASSAAMAGSLSVPQIPVDATLVRTYHCDGGKALKVTYFNHQGGQSFALLLAKDQPLLFVDTLAASGVKYVAGPYTWWTKGNGGDLYDATSGPDTPPILAHCTSQ